MLSSLWLQHRCFPVKFAKFLRTAISKSNTCERLLWLLTHFKPLVFFYAPINTKKTLKFPHVFRGLRKKLMAWNGLIFNLWKELRHRFDSNWFGKSLKNRSSVYRSFFFGKGILKNFGRFSGKYLYRSLFLIKFQTYSLKLY